MPHIDEFTLMMYVDDELTDDELQEVERHLPLCPACQEMLLRLQADHALLSSMFVDDHKMEPIQLNRFTLVQVEAIASLHKQNKPLLSKSLLIWIFLLFSSLLLFAMSIENRVTEWLSHIWIDWGLRLFWVVTFWLKKNILDFLLSPGTYATEIILLFTMLVGALVLLNTRYSQREDWKHLGGGNL